MVIEFQKKSNCKLLTPAAATCPPPSLTHFHGDEACTLEWVLYYWLYLDEAAAFSALRFWRSACEVAACDKSAGRLVS